MLAALSFVFIAGSAGALAVTPDSTEISYGSCIEASIDAAGEVDTLTFSASAGDVVIIRMNRTSGELNPYLELFGPDGSSIATAGPIWSTFNRAEILDRVLEMGGTYTLLVRDDDGIQTGDYALSLQCTNDPGNPTPLAYGGLAEGSVAVRRDRDAGRPLPPPFRWPRGARA